MKLEEILKQCELLDSLNHINRALKSRKADQITEAHLKKFSNLLKSSFFCIDLKTYPVLCEICQAEPASDSMILSCSHVICSEQCLLAWLDHQLEGNYHLFDKAQCICGELINRAIVIKVLSNIEGIESKKRESAFNSEPTSSCAICYKIKKISEFITLDCDHRFCKDCIENYVQENIRQGVWGDRLGCPSCSTPIDFNIINSLLDNSLQSLYHRLSLRGLELKDEILFQCPQGCKFAEVVSKDSKTSKCTECKIVFCILCKDQEHPNQSCEENRKLKTFISDPLLKEKFENGLLKYCPWCMAGVEKDPRGCKYMTCHSPECKGKKYFCFDCLVKLNKFHEKHECKTPEVQTRECRIF
jgi:hypothetical protein